MSRVLVYFARFTLILIAYVCASLAASAFLHVMSLGALGFRPDTTPQFIMGSLVFSIPFVALFVAYFAFLPALPAILVSEALGWRDWLRYALAGAVIALIIIVFFVRAAPSSGDAVAEPRFWAAMIGGGMIGGITYWLVAGRLAGNWRARVQRGAAQNAENA